jgi:hypothetical protein
MGQLLGGVGENPLVLPDTAHNHHLTHVCATGTPVSPDIKHLTAVT